MKHTSTYIILSLSAALTILLYGYLSDFTFGGDVKKIGLVILLSILFVYYSWVKCGGHLLSAYIIFITAFCAFNLGQPILESFGTIDNRLSLLDSYGISNNLFIKAASFGLLSLLFLHIGMLWGIKKRTNYNISKNEEVRQMFLSIKFISICFAVLSFPFFFYNLYQSLSVITLYGYGAADNYYRVPSFVKLLADYYEPSIIGLFFSSEYLNKNKLIVRFLLFITVFMPPLFLGGRANAVIIVAIVLIIYQLFNRIPIRKLILIAVFGYVLIVILALVGKTRNDTGNKVQNMELALNDMEVSPVVSTLTEMGWSMFPLASTMKIIPEKDDYKYGVSYLFALTTIIPNIGIWDVHPAQKYGSPGVWLDHKMDMGFGLGYSIVAESYYNFGIMGFLFFLLYGFFLSKCTTAISKRGMMKNPIMTFACIIVLWFIIKTVRNDFVATVRAIAYVALPFYYLCFIKYRKTR